MGLSLSRGKPTASSTVSETCDMIPSLPIANVSTDRFELTRAVETCFGHDYCARAASEKMRVPERMECVFASVIGTDPAIHRRKREIRYAHRLLLMRFWKNPFALRWRQHIEQLG